jgi:hypothetical protein
MEREEYEMTKAKIEPTALFFGECGHCYGSFPYVLQGENHDGDNQQDVVNEAKPRHVGRCPFCDAEITTPWR